MAITRSKLVAWFDAYFAAFNRNAGALKGVVKTTLIGGQVAYDAAKGLGTPKGELIQVSR